MSTLSLSASGCFLPTKLDPEGQNLAPMFITSEVMPGFGTLTAPGTQELHVVAEDPDLGDKLVTRLFYVTPTEPRHYTQYTVKLDYPMTPDPKHPTRRSGTYFAETGGFDLCSSALGGGGDLFVVVADRDFSNMQGILDKSSGLTDENHWTIRCP